MSAQPIHVTRSGNGVLIRLNLDGAQRFTDLVSAEWFDPFGMALYDAMRAIGFTESSNHQSLKGE